MHDTISGREPAPGSPSGGGWGWMLPLAWVGLAMLLALRGVWSLLPLAFESALPGGVIAWVRASLVVATVTLVWGGWLFVLAHDRSRRLRGGFIAWQVFHLVALSASVGWTLLVDDFASSPSGLLLPAAEAAVSIALLWHARRLPEGTAPRPGDPDGSLAAAQPPSAGGRILHAVVGAIVGAVLGGVVGFPLGVFLADRLDISCFEGGCGYFAAAIGLLGILLGFIAGIVVALWRTRARSRPRAG